MSMLRTWAPYFQSSARTKGRAYQLSGRVSQLPPQEGELVRAQVRGGQTYTVTISGQGSSATANCSCPRYATGTYCKHIWATLLEVQRHGLFSQGNPAATSAVIEEANLPGQELKSPKARKRDPGQKNQPVGEPAWVGRLSMLRPAALGLDPAAPQGFLFQQQVCYLIDPELSMRHNALVVELHQRQPTRTGWSKPKPLRIATPTLHELSNAADREIAALLLGASGLDSSDGSTIYSRDRGQCIFRLPVGARRALLIRMISTGRCFINTDQDLGSGSMPVIDQPLEVWDDGEPWMLWSTGKFNNGDLSLSVELRRADEVMSIEVPTLVLGGPDGLLIHRGVAYPFDDRESPRWVQQFRDESRVLGSAWAITVPQSDIPRFLERLYMLPQLPEIDLPEGISRREVRLDPVPHVELFNPGEALMSPSDPTKGLLNARVWFAYGEFKVRPGQPGRFVATTNEPLADDAALEAELAEVGDLPPGDDAANAAENSDPITDASDKRDRTWTTAEEKQAAEAIAARAVADAKTSTAESADPNALAPDWFDLDDDEEPIENAENEAADEEMIEEPALGLENGDTTQSVLPIRRNHRREEEAVASLVPIGFRQYAAADTLQLPAKLLPQAVTTLLDRGWVVTADQKLIHRSSPPRVSIASGVDWFELRGSVKFETADGEQTVGLPEILAAARAGQNMITLGDGSQGMLPTDWLASHGLLLAVGQLQSDHLRFKLSQVAVLDALLSRQEVADVDAKFAQARQQLAQFDAIHPLDPAEGFAGSLRPYQREGLGWLGFQRWFGLGGILADDMGLGKTVQVLAMLDRRHFGPDKDPGDQVAKPSLIVVPRSVVFNWIDEAKRFTPRLRVQAYTGSDRVELRNAFANHDVIVTSYGLMRRDIAELSKHKFDYLVLDEAQAIKNPASQSAKAARLINSNHRLALTGTPVENHLGDLWSIFDFLNPGMLGAVTKFNELLREGDNKAARSSPQTAPANAAGDQDADIEADGSQGPRIRLRTDPRDVQMASQLGKVLRPLILRRTKGQVLRELPEKTEQTILCQMEPPQRAIYDGLLQHYRGTLLNQVQARGVGGSAMMVLEALLRLRQAACHPGLIDPARSADPSAKLETLVERLVDLIEGGQKSLVFSQFTSMLALVRKRLDERNITYEYLDGQTRHRRLHVQRFQTDPQCPVFLISLKAGGLGLNLTAAEYVFILDPWWNPAVEAQAIDRAHRIGQTKPVFAYRLICEDTVEQRIAELQQKKKKLADAILGGQENLLRNLTRDDLEKLLS